MFVDIHTHNDNIDNQNVIKIVNLNFKNFQTAGIGSRPDFCRFSLGIHPWDADSCFSLDSQDVTDFFKDNLVIAVGESGIDRVRKENFERQREIFIKMVGISERFRKPLIIHAVRSYPDIISVKKLTKARMPWIIHGFQGSPESARQLINHNMYLSFGEMLYRNENQAVSVLNSIPLDRIFFETDVSERKIFDVYEKAALLLRCERDFLEETIFGNFKTIFGDGELEKQNTYINR